MPSPIRFPEVRKLLEQHGWALTRIAAVHRGKVKAVYVRQIKNTSAKLDRPFAADVLKRAKAVVSRYQVIVWFEDGEYFGRGLELPGVMADGKTAAACFAATQEALTFAVATLLESGQTPPTPAAEGQRSEQVNIRLSVEEKLELEAAAKQRGYRGLADYFRAAALAIANAPFEKVSGAGSIL